MTNHRSSTPAAGVEAHRAAQALGGADPHPQVSIAEMLDQVAARAVAQANGNGKRKIDVAGWTKWGVGLLVLFLGAWWTLGTMFNERPTEMKVEKLIENRKPHPDLKMLSETNAKLIQQQEVDLGIIKTGINNIQKSLDQHMLADKPRRDR